jgi:L-asparaginase/N4-(beta-N-acetylglucosaminyl)-L-asparaginase
MPAASSDEASVSSPVVISTWTHGRPANDAAWTVLAEEGSALDAVEQGVRVSEADPDVRTVGRGGYPDRTGVVTLDACIMDADGRCGSVAALEDIQHPTSVARAVMEDTPHVMLAGDGARDFAVEQGFEPTDLLTEQSRQDWNEWRASNDEGARPTPNVENEPGSESHDTIGMLALDTEGRLAGACTTSGTAWKHHGRVGDSPLIGAGLYVDGTVGAACATGWGEAVMRVAGSHLAVETMRQGASPQAACRRVVERIDRLHGDLSDVQVGVLALDTNGDIGAYSLQPGFDTARDTLDGGSTLIEAACLTADE